MSVEIEQECKSTVLDTVGAASSIRPCWWTIQQISLSLSVVNINWVFTCEFIPENNVIISKQKPILLFVNSELGVFLPPTVLGNKLKIRTPMNSGQIKEPWFHWDISQMETTVVLFQWWSYLMGNIEILWNNYISRFENVIVTQFRSEVGHFTVEILTVSEWQHKETTSNKSSSSLQSCLYWKHC